MSRDRSRRIEDLFASALELPPEERRRYLDEVSGDPELAAEVGSLLDHLEDSADFLETPAVAYELGFEAEAPPPLVGHELGGYRVLRLLGEGGMGVVYLAEQASPRRTVAVKLLRSGFLSPRAAARFEHEAELLGRLRHPGIAQIYAAGTASTSAGSQPFFAMELVEGLPLLDYAAARNLGLIDRLRLFQRICEAVQHAHQKGVVHLDLKPGNILVEDGGQPKVLDFGVARATDADLEQRETLRTNPGLVIGTLPYMSPEQVRGERSEIDTRSDVYSLGVVAYELLTGDLPYELRGLPLHEAARVISEEPPRPSGRLDPRLRGDVETILGKALRKEKEERYGSVQELAADIDRHLEHIPITARPPSAVYQISRFARRNRGFVASAALVLLALVAGTVATAWQARRAEHLRQIAVEEAAVASAVNEFLLEDVIAPLGTEANPDRDLSLRAAIDRGVARIGDRFAGQPAVEGRLREAVGTAYLTLGEYATAEEHLGRALALRAQPRAADGEPTLRIRALIARAALESGDLRRAAPLWRALVADRTALLGEEHADTISSLHSLAQVLMRQGALDEAETIAREVHDSALRTLDPLDLQVASAKNLLGSVVAWSGRDGEAEPLLREAYELSLSSIGPDHPHTLGYMHGLAQVLLELNRLAEAEELIGPGLGRCERVLGPEHPHTLSMMSMLAKLRLLEGRSGESRALFEELIPRQRRASGISHPNTLAVLSALALIESREGRFARARELLEEALEYLPEVLGPEHSDTLTVRASLAAIYLQEGRLEEAAPLQLELLEIQRRTAGASHPQTRISENNLAAIYYKLGRFAEAEQLWRPLTEALRVEGAPSLPQVLRNLGTCLIELERLDEALDLVLEAHTLLERSLGPRHAETLRAATALVRIHELRGDEPEQRRWAQLIEGAAEGER